VTREDFKALPNLFSVQKKTFMSCITAIKTPTNSRIKPQ